jgi:hypothetical protein
MKHLNLKFIFASTIVLFSSLYNMDKKKEGDSLLKKIINYLKENKGEYNSALLEHLKSLTQGDLPRGPLEKKETNKILEKKAISFPQENNKENVTKSLSNIINEIEESEGKKRENRSKERDKNSEESYKRRLRFIKKYPLVVGEKQQNLSLVKK